MHKPEPFLKNETHKIFKDFEIQTDHLILFGSPDLEMNKKRTCRKKENFAVPADHRVKIKENDQTST